MSHQTRKITASNNSAFANVIFTAYTAGLGGEQFTLSEFGLTGTGVVGIVFFDTVDAINGTENPAHYCKYMGGGKVMLMNPATPDVELPTSSGLHISIWAGIEGQ